MHGSLLGLPARQKSPRFFVHDFPLMFEIECCLLRRLSFLPLTLLHFPSIRFFKRRVFSFSISSFPFFREKRQPLHTGMDGECKLIDLNQIATVEELIRRREDICSRYNDFVGELAKRRSHLQEALRSVIIYYLILFV